MKEFMLSVSKNGRFLFRTDWDDHSRVVEAANEIHKGMPHVKVAMYSRENTMSMVDYFPAIYPYKTHLKNVSDIAHDMGISRSSCYALLDYYQAGLEVEVLCEAADGYFDIRLPNGNRIDALSGHHLAQVPSSL